MTKRMILSMMKISVDQAALVLLVLVVLSALDTQNVGFPPYTVRCGCMDPSADNYDPMAQAHVAGSCVYDDGSDGGFHGPDSALPPPNPGGNRNRKKRNY